MGVIWSCLNIYKGQQKISELGEKVPTISTIFAIAGQWILWQNKGASATSGCAQVQLKSSAIFSQPTSHVQACCISSLYSHQHCLFLSIYLPYQLAP